MVELEIWLFVLIVILAIGVGARLMSILIDICAEDKDKCQCECCARISTLEMDLNTARSRTAEVLDDLALWRARYKDIAGEKAKVEDKLRGKEVDLQEFEYQYDALNAKYKELEDEYNRLKNKYEKPKGCQGCCMKPVKNVGESCDWEGR